jgi:hypothetical protein
MLGMKRKEITAFTQYTRRIKMDRDKLKAMLKHCEDYNSKYDGKPLDINKLADHLIANGIGDITAEKHRAEVAEEALKLACNEGRHNYYMTGTEALIDNYKQQAEQRLKEKKE